MEGVGPELDAGADAFTTDTPQSFATFLAEENTKNGRIADEAGIQPE